jgi:PhzF family phenazine biosynthesis protein
LIENRKSKMKLPLYWVDAFTEKTFHGNPAAVVPLDRWLPDETMQHIASENGLAETAFFVRTGTARFHLRWFTPAVEVELCGHATLTTAFTLFSQLNQTGSLVTFDSKSGPLTVTHQGGLLELDFPSTPPAAESTALREVTAAIGRAPQWLGRTRFDLFAVVPDAAAVEALRPDLTMVAALGGRGLIVTAAGVDCDFVSRFFAPQVGVPEDPVTGSAHCALIPYWANQLGKTRLHARQVSARGGELWCELRGDRVGIAGHAVLYLRGEIEI